tara:strand:- start:134 stop:418 length:285 start_codon:yes stop_codon:yes gene_type:complete
VVPTLLLLVAVIVVVFVVARDFQDLKDDDAVRVDAAFTIARGEDHVVIAFLLEVRGVCSSSSSFLCGWSTRLVVSGIYSILKVVALLFAVKRLS